MRCYICDYSQTGLSDGVDKKSLDFNRKVVYDSSIGKDICTDCLIIASDTLYELEIGDEDYNNNKMGTTHDEQGNKSSGALPRSRV